MSDSGDDKGGNRVDVVAIDGPAGSGKSTVARGLAAELGFTYIDSGAMYRVVTLAALMRSVDLADEAALGEVARSVTIGFDGPTTVTLDGEDVTAAIREPELTAQVRHIARATPVRDEMRLQQRRLGLASASVMEGRDIGTVVFPDGRWKFYLDASVEERARRRRVELEARGISLTDDELRNEITERDRTDLEREVAPLKCADDAERIDTTGMGIDEVVAVLAACVRGETP